MENPIGWALIVGAVAVLGWAIFKRLFKFVIVGIVILAIGGFLVAT